MGGAEKRAGDRVPLSVPLQVRWRHDDGRLTEEQTETEVLNSAGARIRLQHPVEMGLEVEVVNLENRESAQARVAWAGEFTPASGQRVGIEFLTPKAAFWGSKYSR